MNFLGWRCVFMCLVLKIHYFIKRLQRVKGRKLAVKSDNPAYETFYIEESEMYDLPEIIGKVIKPLPH